MVAAFFVLIAYLSLGWAYTTTLALRNLSAKPYWASGLRTGRARKIIGFSVAANRQRFVAGSLPLFSLK